MSRELNVCDTTEQACWAVLNVPELSFVYFLDFLSVLKFLKTIGQLAEGCMVFRKQEVIDVGARGIQWCYIGDLNTVNE